MSASPHIDKVCLAVDCMGGDHGPSVTLPACQAFLNAHPEAELILVGRADAVAPAAAWPRCTTVVASEVVEMDDPIEVALRRKKDSSMRLAIQQVKPDDAGESAAQACVSAGNTGALMAVSRYLLKTLEGIDRPAIATVMPNELDGYTTVLDLGANVALKTAEGLAAMLSSFVKQEFTRNLFTRLAALAALPVLSHLKARVDHRRYNGAALLGLRGLVFKSHGSADAFAFEHALNRAYDAARNGLLVRVHDRILETLQAMPAVVSEDESTVPTAESTA